MRIRRKAELALTALGAVLVAFAIYGMATGQLQHPPYCVSTPFTHWVCP
jgi:hypothetical protein